MHRITAVYRRALLLWSWWLTLALKVEASFWSAGIRATSTNTLGGQLSSPKMSNTESSAWETTHSLLSFEIHSLSETPTTWAWEKRKLTIVHESTLYQTTCIDNLQKRSKMQSTSIVSESITVNMNQNGRELNTALVILKSHDLLSLFDSWSKIKHPILWWMY